VLHGPNLNLLGRREPEIYGRLSLAEIDAGLARRANELGVEVECRQSNHEGQLIDWVQAARDGFQGLVLNPGGLTHTSVALRDAVAAAGLPVVEVHLSNIYAREEFRRESMIAAAAWGCITGLGAAGYQLAMEALAGRLKA
jgi:3-dehydroquinate dehydratase-2